MSERKNQQKMEVMEVCPPVAVMKQNKQAMLSQVRHYHVLLCTAQNVIPKQRIRFCEYQ